ncbi:MAG: hypothetical protein AAB642_03105 [Patescibacteria group bacterium]|mgnify:CR=1 FL=1
MNAFVNAVVMTADLFWHMLTLEAEEVYDYIAPRAAVYMRALAYTTLAVLVAVPALLLFKMVTGWQICAYLAAIIAVLATLALGVAWSPLVAIISMIRRRSVNPVARAEKYVRFVGTALFTELMLTVYIALVPFHQNVGNIPMLLLLGAAFALGSMIWGGWLSGKFFTRVALLMILVLTASFFLPKTFHKIGQAVAAIDETLANPPAPKRPSVPAASVARQPLQVIRVQVEPNRESDWVTLPPGRQCNVKARGGKMFFIFPNGQRMEVRAGEADSGMLPGRRFKLVGETAGEAVFTVY